MQISLKWLNELINIDNINQHDLIEKLTLGGFEVEDIIETEIYGEPDTILDISATANRADSLSTYGLAKEISALLDEKITISKYAANNFKSIKTLDKLVKAKETSNFENLSIFSAITIENLTNLSSPNWLKQKLISAGITPSNDLLDYQQYIILETGYPFEFYDLLKLKKILPANTFHLKIEQSHSSQSFLSNNGQSLTFDNKSLILKANDEILSVAGIISNHKYKYSKTTTELLIEGSIYNSKKIRQTSRVLGVRTDRSARYEKDLVVSGFNEALLRLLSLLKTQNPSLKYALHTLNSKKSIESPLITLNYKTVNEILGPITHNSKKESNLCYLKPEQISTYLNRLTFIFSYNGQKESWEVEVPKSRMNDITREIDLIEEIGRLHGFNNFTTCLPTVINIGNEDLSYKLRKKLTTCFINEGFIELIQYSLNNQFSSTTIKLVNPLINECSTLRESLLPGLIDAAKENVKNTNQILNGFEFGHIFKTSNLNKYSEIEYVGGIIGCDNNTNDWSNNKKANRQVNWFEAKGRIEKLFTRLNLIVNWKNTILEPTIYKQTLHPYRTATLYLDNNEEIGIFGQIHPILANQLNVNKNLYLFEFNFEKLRQKLNSNKLKVYKTYSLYPKITKDLSFIVPQSIHFSQIRTIIEEAGTQFITNIELLDVYRDEKLLDDHVSLCVQLTFQSPEKTLLSKEVDFIMDNIQNKLINKFNINIRG